MTQEWWLNALWSVTPTIIIGILFGLIIYAAINGDRKVRRERANVEGEERARFAAERAADKTRTAEGE
ncbi:hypothetical protein [Gulosibacter molinativorax]|uniref:Lysyl-tRNA synthetase n=1 Tax=Gulosibacter molinativorax TaxID=256821 RepID=A0ABT7C6Z1_9MICO|nr:hypothetical protein [Gulosibacter molinativorax]MDJ1370927.1 hypothetical protein [Gulosibacter molinativorax]QUY62717.1 Hypotetical protein [Gulosibacter molinativorax]